MLLIQAEHAGRSRLRVVFGDAVVSCSLAADATFGEIARTLGELSNQLHGKPVAIDVILAARESSSARRIVRRPSPKIRR